MEVTRRERGERQATHHLHDNTDNNKMTWWCGREGGGEGTGATTVKLGETNRVRTARWHTTLNVQNAERCYFCPYLRWFIAAYSR